MLGISRDITESRQAQDETRNLNSALENAVEGIARSTRTVGFLPLTPLTPGYSVTSPRNSSAWTGG